MNSITRLIKGNIQRSTAQLLFFPGLVSILGTGFRFGDGHSLVFRAREGVELKGKPSPGTGHGLKIHGECWCRLGLGPSG